MASVNLREKPLSNGTASLVLGYHEHGVRHKQTLKIYVNPQDAKSRNPIQRTAYDEAYRMAKLVKNWARTVHRPGVRLLGPASLLAAYPSLGVAPPQALGHW